MLPKTNLTAEELENLQEKYPDLEISYTLGAAYLAGLAVGYWKDLTEIRRNWQVSCAFSPEASHEDAEKKMAGWHHAVKQARL